MTLKNGFGKCSFTCFIRQWMKRSKHGLFVFPPKNPNMEKALFHWPIVLQYGVKAKYRLISRKFYRSLNQPKTKHVCIRSTNQSNRSISVRLLFLFCSRVFISRSYENRSITSIRGLEVGRRSFFDPGLYFRHVQHTLVMPI